MLKYFWTTTYQHPGLYEYVCYQHLAYQAPRVLSAFLIEQVVKAQEAVAKLKILEIGAGSGLTARVLSALGVTSITGIDLCPEAAKAAQREAPNLYSDYHVTDFAQIKPAIYQELKNKDFNCLVCCSALPAIPVSAFANAINLIRFNGWLVFNVKKDIWDDNSATGFAQLHPWVVDNNVFEQRAQLFSIRRYTTFKQPVEEIIVIGTKKNDIIPN
ncbi:hypothetical protein TI05_08210 [Achromatium sp. WMS3]|nr:hypothetical protein TI05_08210 [Achromatium sp. WMS3]